MTLDRRRVEEKLAFIAQQAADLRHLASSVTRERFTADPWLVRGAKYALQTAIEAMLDILYHLSAKAFCHAPLDGRDALDHLTSRGVFTAAEAAVVREMIGFRNRLVHGYERVSDERVYEIISTRLGDFDRFLATVRRFLSGEGGDG